VKPGLYGKELAATGGSKSRAVNSGERNFTVEKLRERIARLEGQTEEYLKELDENDGKEEEAGSGEKSGAAVSRQQLPPKPRACLLCSCSSTLFATITRKVDPPCCAT
jgi:hypothetical protein